MVHIGENPKSKREKHVHYWIKVGETEYCKCGKEREVRKDFPTLENIPHRNTESKESDD